MPLDIEIHNQYMALAKEVEKLQDDYFTLFERVEMNPTIAGFKEDLNAKKIELAQANQKLKNFAKNHKIRNNE